MPIIGDTEPSGRWDTRRGLLKDALKKAARHIPWMMVERDKYTATGLELTEDMTEILTVCNAVSRLPWQLRRLIELRYWHDLTQEKSADREGLALSAVKERLYIAYQRLEEMIWPKQPK